MSEKELRCPACNAVIPKGAKECPACGRMIISENDTYLDVIDRLEKRPVKKENRVKKVVPPEHRIAGLAIGFHGFLLLVSFGVLMGVDPVLGIYSLIFGAASLWAGVATFIGHPKGPIATVILGIFAIFSPNTWLLPILLGSIAIAGITVPWLFNVMSRRKV